MHMLENTKLENKSLKYLDANDRATQKKYK